MLFLNTRGETLLHSFVSVQLHPMPAAYVFSPLAFFNVIIFDLGLILRKTTVYLSQNFSTKMCSRSKYVGCGSEVSVSTPSDMKILQNLIPPPFPQIKKNIFKNSFQINTVQYTLFFVTKFSSLAHGIYIILPFCVFDTIQ